MSELLLWLTTLLATEATDLHGEPRPPDPPK